MRKLAAPDADFAEVVSLIVSARQRAYRAVNTTLIELYWRVGEYLSRKIENAEWGDGVVRELARHLARTQPGLHGFTRPNLFRMRQFYEAYRNISFVLPVASQLSPADRRSAKKGKVSALLRQIPSAGRNSKKVSALLTQLPWTHHLIILGQSKRAEEREFYLRMAIEEKWSRRQLERQFKAALFERAVLHPPKVSPLVRQLHPDALAVFKDAYLVEFLDLPQDHAEPDLQRGLLLKLRDFLIELGRDFCFVGSEFPVQVGGRDFALDLLFFHRGLNCLIAIELKVGRFEPEYLGKLRKAHERPAIGVLLCASKDAEVVEYALSRTLSPALIAEYQTQLPDKKLLRAKLHEFYLQNAPDGGA